jgi:hypothetical protein
MDGSTAELELEPRRRRRSLRRSVQLETEVTSDLWDGAITLLATDISLHGMWLEADFPLGIGSELTISFTPPDCPQRNPIRAQGTVVRVSLLRRRTDYGHAGMGVAFHDLSADQVQRLTRALHGMPPPVPRRKDPYEQIARVASVALEDGRAYTMVSEAPLMTAGRVEAALGAGRASSPMSAIFRTRRALEYYY